MNNLRIYFSGSISGGRDLLQNFRIIVERLKTYGAVLTEHIADPNLEAGGEDMHSDEIFQRDLEFLNDADIIIGEVTTPSLGVGYELAWGVEQGKPVHALFCTASGRRLSAMVDGNPGIHVHRYSDVGELAGIISNIFEK